MIGEHFYHRTTRKIVVAFGTMFNNMTMIRYNKDMTEEYERIKVPLSYGPKEKFINRIFGDPNLTKSINISVPRMSFELKDMSYDPSRKLTSTTRNLNEKSSDQFYAQYVPVPYDFNFTLSVYVRNIEDGTQIIEQILPFFTPDFNVTVNLIPNINRKFDLPIILNNVTQNIDYEGGFENTRLITWDLDFTVKSYLFGKISNVGIIKNTIISIFNQNDSLTQKAYVDIANSKGQFIENEVVRVKDKITFGVLKDYNANSEFIVVNQLNQKLSANDIVVGDESRAIFKITNVEDGEIRLVKIDTTYTPNTATIFDDFEYVQTIQEYPNIS